MFEALMHPTEQLTLLEHCGDTRACPDLSHICAQLVFTTAGPYLRISCDLDLDF